jgi:hypothetical protein
MGTLPPAGACSERSQVPAAVVDLQSVSTAHASLPRGSRAALATVLAREDDLLLRVASGDHTARRELNRTALQRAVHADRLATQLGLPSGASLRRIVSAVEEPWRSILGSHWRRMRTTSVLASCEIPPAVADFLC